MAEETQAAPANGVSNTTTITETREAPSVPDFRLTEERSKRNKAFAERDSAISQLEKMKQEMESLRTQLSSQGQQHSQEMHLIERGFSAPSVRRFFRREYQAAVSELPADKRPEFSDWLDSNREDPLYAVHFSGQAAPATPQAQAQAQAEAGDPATLKALLAALKGNPDAGTGQPRDVQQVDWTDANEIKKLRARNNGTLGKHAADVLAAWRAKGIIK